MTSPPRSDILHVNDPFQPAAAKKARLRDPIRRSAAIDYVRIGSAGWTRRYARKASLTAASSAKASATSSAKRTTRSRSRYRAAYLPRTIPRIDRKSYSGRSSSSADSVSSGEVAIFVVSPLTSARLAGTDDPHFFATIRMRHFNYAAGFARPLDVLYDPAESYNIQGIRRCHGTTRGSPLRSHCRCSTRSQFFVKPIQPISLILRVRNVKPTSPRNPVECRRKGSARFHEKASRQEG